MTQDILPCQIPNITVSGLMESGDVFLDRFSDFNSAAASLLVAVTNHSDQPLVAISSLWSIEKNDGTVESMNNRCDVFLGTGRAFIAGPHSSFVLGPNSCIPGDLLVNARQLGFASSMDQRTAARLIGSRLVTIKIDAAMFGNGDMYAEEDSHSRDMEARLSAAAKFYELANQSRVNGQSAEDLLSAIKTIPDISGSERMWLDLYAHQSRVRRTPVAPVQPFAHLAPLRINFHKVPLKA